MSEFIEPAEVVAGLAGLGIWRMDCTDPMQSLDWDARAVWLHDISDPGFIPSLGTTLLLYEDESRGQLEDALMRCSLSGAPFEVEVDLPLTVGGVRRLLVAGQPQNGGREIVGYYQDVTHRQALVRRLELEQSQLRALLKTLPDLLFGVDSSGFLRHYYSGKASLLHEAPESCLGRHVAEVFPYMRQQFPQAFKRSCESGEVATLEFQVNSLEGESMFEARILPLEVPSPSERALFLIRDISESHRREQESKASQQAALQASRAKSSFLANMSHEIRTPLNGMLGMTELILGTELSSEQRDYAQAAMRSTQGLLEIVNDILDLSKIEANRLEFETIPFSPRTVVQDALAAMSLRAHEKGLEIVGSVDPSVPSRLVGDPTRIRQLLTNLLSNAVKFTAQGEVELQLSQREAGTLKVAVYDTGEGIPYERQSHIFDPFTQADDSTTRRHGGTGLGLTICRQMVEKMGGRIWLESQPGQGSCFSFTVRLSNYHTEVLEGDISYHAFLRDLDRADVSLEEFRVLQQKRLLIVDDNASCRRALKETLGTWGIEAQVALGPGPALQVIRENLRRGRQFDLVLLDFQMPGCDGLELARELPENLIRVLLTTLGRPVAEQLEAAKIHRVITKPVLGHDLALLLLELFRKRSEESVASQEVRYVEPLTILLAEDNMVNAKVVSKMAQRLGHNVIHVVNGQLALEYLSQHPVDVVLMDVQMPVMDGFESTRRWRAVEVLSGGHVPIVALTGNAMLSDREACLEAGMDLHLTKPIRLEVLDQVLTSLSLGGQPRVSLGK